jgi:hypothetical protein
MTPADDDFLQEMLRHRLIGSPCLELGAGYDGPTSRSRLLDSGITYISTDLHPGPGVDLVIDFESAEHDVLHQAGARRFKSILVFNILEHTFEPLRVLDNVLLLLESGGTVLVITPAVWPLHSFPQDCYRFNPDFYERYALTRGLEIIPGTFQYLGFGVIDSRQTQHLPSPGRSPRRALYSRIIHRLFNTFGRSMFFPSHVAIGVVFRMPVKTDRQAR